MPMLSAEAARAQLRAIGLTGQEDFHALSSSTVDKIIAAADAARYRKPKDANGSRARYFHAMLVRRATSLTALADDIVRHRSSTVTVSWPGQRRRVTRSTEDVR